MSGAGVGVGMLSKYNAACGSKYNVALTIVECRDGSQYVEGCWGFHYLKIKKSWLFGFLVFCLLVSKFLGSKVYLFRSFLVSWFQNFKVSKIQ